MGMTVVAGDSAAMRGTGKATGILTVWTRSNRIPIFTIHIITSDRRPSSSEPGPSSIFWSLESKGLEEQASIRAIVSESNGIKNQSAVKQALSNERRPENKAFWQCAAKSRRIIV